MKSRISEEISVCDNAKSFAIWIRGHTHRGQINMLNEHVGCNISDSVSTVTCNVYLVTYRT